jgi:hypothetical protein
MIKPQFQNIPEKKIKSGGKKSSDCFIEMKKQNKKCREFVSVVSMDVMRVF